MAAARQIRVFVFRHLCRTPEQPKPVPLIEYPRGTLGFGLWRRFPCPAAARGLASSPEDGASVCMCPRKNRVCPVFGKESREVLTVGRSLGPSSPLSVRFEGGELARPRQPGANIFTAVGTGWRRLGRCGGRAVGRMGVTALAGRVTSWSCQSTWFWMRDTPPIDGCLLRREWWRRRRMDSGTRGRMGGRWIAEKNLLPESEIGTPQRCCGRVVGVCKRSQDELSCHSEHDRDRPGKQRLASKR